MSPGSRNALTNVRVGFPIAAGGGIALFQQREQLESACSIREIGENREPKRLLAVQAPVERRHGRENVAQFRIAEER